MKRIISLALAVLMLTSLLAGCASKDASDKGAIVQMYLMQDPSTFSVDPALMLYNSETVKLINLIFEGLTVIDEDGKVKPALAKSWTIIEDEENNTYKMQFELKNTRWSDSRAVQAQDVVYAWKRILEPEFSSPAAALLYPIKNARLVREGEMTVDDLGLYALSETLLEVQFEGPYDYEYFLRTIASPALVPLREDVVTAPELWTDKASTIVTNGPFAIKAMEYQKQLVLERSTFYMTQVGKTEKADKYVTPYRLVINYSGSADTDLPKQIEAFNSGKIFYLGGIDAANHDVIKGDEVDMLSTYTYFFNTTKSPLNKPEVRQALSIAVDRNKIVELVGTGVKPVAGFVPSAVIDASANKSFREVGGDQINPAGDLAAAKSLLSSAGVSGGSFELKYRAGAVDQAIAEYIKGVWDSLGFSVTLKEARGQEYKNDVMSGNFDVISLDYQWLTDDAYGGLAQFAKNYSGNSMTFTEDYSDTSYTPHITGLDSEEYNAKMDEVLAAKDTAERTTKLHELEAIFVKQSPAMALYSNVSFVATKELSGIWLTKYGTANMTKMKMSNYKDYLPVETTAAAAPAAEKTT
ncbi:MAG: ABC transporter substrate-binding protein [Eubacteriales bacterium]